MTEPSPRPAARDSAAAVLDTEVATFARSGSRAAPGPSSALDPLAVSVIVLRLCTSPPGASRVWWFQRCWDEGTEWRSAVARVPGFHTLIPYAHCVTDDDSTTSVSSLTRLGIRKVRASFLWVGTCRSCPDVWKRAATTISLREIN